MYDKHTLVPSGTVAGGTGASRSCGGVYQAVAFVASVTAVGGTPAFTWKIQATVDEVTWFDVGYITDASDTIAVATRSNIVDDTAQVNFLSNPVARRYKAFRAVTTSTNVTHGIEMFLIV